MMLKKMLRKKHYEQEHISYINRFNKSFLVRSEYTLYITNGKFTQMQGISDKQKKYYETLDCFKNNISDGKITMTRGFYNLKNELYYGTIDFYDTNNKILSTIVGQINKNFKAEYQCSIFDYKNRYITTSYFINGCPSSHTIVRFPNNSYFETFNYSLDKCNGLFYSTAGHFYSAKILNSVLFINK